MSREEVKTIKTIRDYPIKKKNPFAKKKNQEGTKNYLSKDRSFSVGIVSDSISLTGIHKVGQGAALDVLGDILKEKLDITKGGINVFKYIYNSLEKDNDGQPLMTFRVNFEHCRDTCNYTSTQSVWYGLAELLDKNIIARSAIPGVYFLNPNFFHPTGSIVVTEYYKLQAGDSDGELDSEDGGMDE